jgi:hypothetical protein
LEIYAMKKSQTVRVALLRSVAAAVFVGCASPDRQHDSAKRKLDGDPAQAVKRLYLDLLSFKDASRFHKRGFGVASPYHEWLQSVNSIEDNKEFIDTLLPLGVVPGGRFLSDARNVV